VQPEMETANSTIARVKETDSVGLKINEVTTNDSIETDAKKREATKFLEHNLY
jgi:hypothetical protein